MLAKIKKFLTASPQGKRITHYAEIFAATFGLAAISSAEHIASMHQPIGWSVLAGVAVAGVKAAWDVAKPILIGKLASKATAA